MKVRERLKPEVLRWPTKSGYPSEMRSPLKRPNLSEQMFAAKGVTAEADHQVHKWILGGTGVAVMATCVIYILQLLPNVPPTYWDFLTAFFTGPMGLAVKYGFTGGLLIVAGYLTVFRVLRIKERRKMNQRGP